MKNSAIALAVLVLGAACQHGSSSSGTGAGTASAGAPDASQGAQQPSGGGAQASGPLSQDPIMEPGPSIKAHASDDIVTGVISDVSGDAVSIESDRGETRTLSIVPQTTIRVDGHDASADDLAEGQPVRASFNEVEGEEVAVEIRAGDAGAPSDATTPSDAGGTPHSAGPSGSSGAGAPDSGTGAGGTPHHGR